jgi:hypothetical protein
MLKHTFLLLVMITLALAPFHLAGAQGEIKLSALEVDLWPEYDQPTLLVIYRISLLSTTSLPVDLTFRIPAAAGEPSAVAVKQTTSTGEAGLFTIPYERRVEGEWGLISFTATMPEIQLEYYDPSLIKDGANRHFEYRWPGDYAVDSFVVQVQQPVAASQMQISPASGSGVPGNDGLIYYNKQIGSLPAGQSFTIKVSYQKANDELSITSLKVQPSAPVTTVTPGQNTLITILPWVLAALGLVLLVGGAVWYWQAGKSKESAPSRRRRPVVEQEEVKEEGYIYCHQCGKRALPGDRFCRMCGTKLRTE